jgi:hypothetical protein
MRESQTEVLIVGGGTGGVAAALSVNALGYRAILTEETDWVGGQLTAQAVPADEHPWIESFGCTWRYRRFRQDLRAFYRHNYPLTPAARANPVLNPGEGQVSRLCVEPRTALAALEARLAYPRSRGDLEVRLRRKAVGAEVQGDRVTGVTLRDLETGDLESVSADYVLDATELGDLLPLAGVEYVSGAESQLETGEPHAVSGAAQVNNVQSFTWCFPMAYDPAGSHVVDRPETYSFWRDYVPDLTPAWPGRLLSWTAPEPRNLQAVTRELFPTDPEKPWLSLWLYRRITASAHYPPGAMPHEVTLVNWPQNDYWLGNIIDQPEAVVQRHLEGARQLSMSLLYWLQTEAPRLDGKAGYPGLYLRPDLAGTKDGLAKAVYIRESRRIRAVFTVTENHVGAEARGGRPAEDFDDSVGIGSYRIDLHPSAGGTNYIDISSLPFQIPLGALLPVRVRNLLPACKNIGATHITNGCYRLHPVEWTIGEAAGLLAGFCLKRHVEPRAVREKVDLLKEFQALLVDQGFELAWPRLGAI